MAKALGAGEVANPDHELRLSPLGRFRPEPQNGSSFDSECRKFDLQVLSCIHRESKESCTGVAEAMVLSSREQRQHRPGPAVSIDAEKNELTFGKALGFEPCLGPTASIGRRGALGHNALELVLAGVEESDRVSSELLTVLQRACILSRALSLALRSRSGLLRRSLPSRYKRSKA